MVFPPPGLEFNGSPSTVSTPPGPDWFLPRMRIGSWKELSLEPKASTEWKLTEGDRSITFSGDMFVWVPKVSMPSLLKDWAAACSAGTLLSSSGASPSASMAMLPRERSSAPRSAAAAHSERMGR